MSKADVSLNALEKFNIGGMKSREDGYIVVK
jgi:hypothetical protein